MTRIKAYKRILFSFCIMSILFSHSFVINAQIDTSLIGKWVGIVNQGGSEYVTEMTINSLVVNESSGETEYPSLPCKGSNFFLGTMDSIHIFSEAIINGGNCADGRVEIYSINSDTIQWNWYFEGSSTITVFGKLERQMEMTSNIEIRDSEFYFFSEVHPNPLSRESNFTLDVKSIENINISLKDISGKKVSTVYQGIIYPHQNKQFKIKSKNLTKGIYILSFKSTNFVISRKLLVEN